MAFLLAAGAGRSHPAPARRPDGARQEGPALAGPGRAGQGRGPGFLVERRVLFTGPKGTIKAFPGFGRGSLVCGGRRGGVESGPGGSSALLQIGQALRAEGDRASGGRGQDEVAGGGRELGPFGWPVEAGADLGEPVGPPSQAPDHVRLTAPDPHKRVVVAHGDHGSAR